MKIFQSLNCSLCSSPFSSKLNNPKTPRKISPCGKLMCNDCFEREKSLNAKKRLHRCSNKGGCSFKNPKPVKYVIDILNSGSLALSSDKTGYVLSKPYKIPGCMLCDAVYSIEKGGHSPCDLYCNHLVCNGCLKKRLVKSETVICPDCSEGKKGATSSANQFKDFLRELPSMTVQEKEEKRKFEQAKIKLDQESLPNFLEGTDRKILTHVNSNLNDSLKLSNVQTVCATGLCQIHRVHSTLGYVSAQAVDAAFDARETTNKSMNHYRDVFQIADTLVNHYSAQLQKRLLKRADGIMFLKSTDEAIEQQKRVRQLIKGFERLSDEFLPHLEAFLEKLQVLVEESGQE